MAYHESFIGADGMLIAYNADVVASESSLYLQLMMLQAVEGEIASCCLNMLQKSERESGTTSHKCH